MSPNLANLFENANEENEMAGAKLIVMYPRPKNVDEFESVYHNEHVPMAVAKLADKDQNRRQQSC